MNTVLKSPSTKNVKMHLLGICRKCKHYHPIESSPELLGKLAFDWQYKHKQCSLELPGAVEFLSTNLIMPKGFDDRSFEAAGVGPRWLEWKPNADVKISYVADAAFTLNLSALGSSATFTAGRESTWITNSSNYLDMRISGSIISGTTPTAPAEHQLRYLSAMEDTPTYPDVFAGTDANKTITNTNIRDSLPIGWSGTASTSSNITYPIVSALTMAQVFGIVPKHFGLFFSHAHTAALKTDAGNTNSIFYQGIYDTVA